MSNGRGEMTGEFRQQLVLRGIYEVGHDPVMLSNYLGLQRAYVIAVMMLHKTKAIKNARAFINGETQPGLSIMDSVRGIGRAFKEKFKRRNAINSMRKRHDGARKGKS
jgi:hypothetical protein